MLPKTNGILESSLYVSDLPRSVRFYQETFGFRAWWIPRHGLREAEGIISN
jgi:catechol 2,3-dioxygenase-like lactoylglutathione lyase family enzyme